jgi:hypothetical protein
MCSRQRARPRRRIASAFQGADRHGVVPAGRPAAVRRDRTAFQRVLRPGQQLHERDRLKHAGRAWRRSIHQGREKRRRWSERAWNPATRSSQRPVITSGFTGAYVAGRRCRPHGSPRPPTTATDPSAVGQGWARDPEGVDEPSSPSGEATGAAAETSRITGRTSTCIAPSGLRALKGRTTPREDVLATGSLRRLQDAGTGARPFVPEGEARPREETTRNVSGRGWPRWETRQGPD